ADREPRQRDRAGDHGFDRRAQRGRRNDRRDYARARDRRSLPASDQPARRANRRRHRKECLAMTRLLFVLAGMGVASGLLLSHGRRAKAAGACPSVNRPNMLRVVAGSPQTAQLEKPFLTNLQVELANSNGCPLTGGLAGVWVDFTAPAGGASGTFATSGANHFTAGTAPTPAPTAPPFPPTPP